MLRRCSLVLRWSSRVLWCSLVLRGLWRRCPLLLRRGLVLRLSLLLRCCLMLLRSLPFLRGLVLRRGLTLRNLLALRFSLPQRHGLPLRRFLVLRLWHSLRFRLVGSRLAHPHRLRRILVHLRRTVLLSRRLAVHFHWRRSAHAAIGNQRVGCNRVCRAAVIDIGKLRPV